MDNDKQINLDDIKKEIIEEFETNHLDKFTGVNKEIISTLILLSANVSKRFIEEYLKESNNQ
ncbi:hypothetical protein JCM16358_22830 [Halanaerocella petrolearia]